MYPKFDGILISKQQDVWLENEKMVLRFEVYETEHSIPLKSISIAIVVTMFHGYHSLKYLCVKEAQMSFSFVAIRVFCHEFSTE